MKLLAPTAVFLAWTSIACLGNETSNPLLLAGVFPEESSVPIEISGDESHLHHPENSQLSGDLNYVKELKLSVDRLSSDIHVLKEILGSQNQIVNELSGDVEDVDSKLSFHSFTVESEITYLKTGLKKGFSRSI